MLVIGFSLLTVLPGSTGLHTARAQATSPLTTSSYNLSDTSDTVNVAQLSTGAASGVFLYIRRSLATDGSVSGRVNSQTNTSSFQ